jgi:four helix bundle protein
MNGIRRFEDFDAWKLSVELRDLVYRMTETGTVLEDDRFRGQIRDSAASAPRNISEGFGRFEPKDFANFTRMAKASLMETQNHLLHGSAENYFSKADYQRAWRLSKRALGATKGLHRYLRSCRGRLPWDPRNPNPGNPRNPNPRNPRNPRNPNRRNPNPRNPRNPEPEEPKEPGTPGTPSRP